MYVARKILRHSKEDPSRVRAQKKFTLHFFYNSPGKGIERGIAGGERVQSRFRHSQGERLRRFVLLTHSFAHLRHSSLPTIQILIQLRERRGRTFSYVFAGPFISFSLGNSLFIPPIPPSPRSPQRNLNLIMTLHVAILAPTPLSVAYLPLASSDVKSCGLSPFCSPPLPQLFANRNKIARTVSNLKRAFNKSRWFLIFTVRA